ncbi:hypothetical protein [Archaeoglobus sp.]
MHCPNCNVPIDGGRVLEILLDRFTERGFNIRLNALVEFVKLCLDEFGEVGVDDVDSFCEFVEKRFRTRNIEMEHVEAYFDF